jgi:hypothetical protein
MWVERGEHRYRVAQWDGTSMLLQNRYGAEFEEPVHTLVTCGYALVLEPGESLDPAWTGVWRALDIPESEEPFEGKLEKAVIPEAEPLAPEEPDMPRDTAGIAPEKPGTAPVLEDLFDF